MINLYFFIKRKKNRPVIELLLKQLWKTSKDTSQAHKVQILFQILLGYTPDSNSAKNSFKNYNIFYHFFYGIKLDNKAEHLFKHNDKNSNIIDKQLLNSGYLSPKLLWRCVLTAFKHFQFLQAFYFCGLLREIYFRWHPSKVLFFQGKCAQLCNLPIVALFLYSCAILYYGMPASISTPGYEFILQKKLNGFYWNRFLSLIQAKNSKINPLKRGQALLIGGAYKEAEYYLLSLPIWYRLIPRYSILLARTYIVRNKSKDAENILIMLIYKFKKYKPAYNEAIRLACLSKNINFGKEILINAQKNNISISPSFEWIMLCHMRKLKEAFISHSKALYFNFLSKYLGNKIIYKLPHKKDNIKTLLVLSECFPGDEVRFSLLYPLIQKKSYAERIIFSCSPSIYKILHRSFPCMNLLSTQRAQSVALLNNYTNFNKLPDPECCRYVDNNGWTAIHDADRIISVTHVLADILEDYSQLSALPHLIPSSEKKAIISARLKKYRPQKLVGLSWRSIQNTLNRDWLNFNIKDLTPLLQMDNIQFINCQYDGCTIQEQHWLDTYFPGKVLTIEDINQKDDVDMAAALYSCLDIMVSVPTYTCEVSGAIGVNTIIFAASFIPEAFTYPGKNYHAFLGKNTIFACNFTNKKEIIKKVKNILQNKI